MVQTDIGAAPQDALALRRAPGKRVAIVQSNYIPWKGYFDLIDRVDEFVLLDDVQYTRRDWRNRNQIKTPQGLHWLSIPLQVRGNYLDAINQMQVCDRGWAQQHWRTIHHHYRQAPGFAVHAGWLEAAYEEAARLSRLSEINELFLRAICRALEIPTLLRRSTDFQLTSGKNERLVELCRQAGATVYLSGPAARSYLDEDAFGAHGLAVEWMSYDGYPPYPQRHGEFSHGVSVVDLLLNTGREARAFALPGRSPARTPTASSPAAPEDPSP